MQYWHWLAAKIRIISLKFTWLNYADFITIHEITVNCIREYRTSVKNLVNSACQLSLKDTAQKMIFSIKDFFSKSDQILIKLRIRPYLPKKSLMEA